MSHVETLPGSGAETTRPVELVDCDVHAQATEPMLAKYLSAPRDACSSATDGARRASPSGIRGRGMPACASTRGPASPGTSGGSDPETMRAQLLDEFGVDYAILEVLSGQDCYDHPDFVAEWNSAVNEWQVEEWLGFDSRLRGTIAVAHEYPQLAVAEIERRASDERFVAVLLPASAAEQLGSPKYWPIYEAATAYGRPVVFHTGGYVDHRGAGYPSFYLEYHVGNGIAMQSQLASMVAGGMFEAIPGLRVILTECGWLGRQRFSGLWMLRGS